jgi:hypothetical protein
MHRMQIAGARISSLMQISKSKSTVTRASTCREISLQKEILACAKQLGNLLRMRQIPLKLEDFPEEILRDVRGCCIFLNACLIFISVFFLRQSKMYSTFPVYRISSFEQQ